jgi:uncharacterized protein (DUF433 family)
MEENEGRRAVPKCGKLAVDRMEAKAMEELNRITLDPAVMGGKPCVRGLRVTVGTVVGLLAAGRSREDILAAYPYLEPEDIDQSLAYAAWRVEEREVPLSTA